MKPLLSVALAVHNEEINIRRCLTSLYGWVDEIIIVDGKSSDATVAVARRFGKKIRIFLEDNPPMFHRNKEKAFQKATGKWILQLDADELVTVSLKKDILNKIKQRDIDAYFIPRTNYFLGTALRKGGQYPDYTTRLYRNGIAHFACKSIHEQVTLKKGTKMGYISQPILHYPYASFSSYLHKWESYCALEAANLYKHNHVPSFTLGLSYFIFKPIGWFFKAYIRHRGYSDGFAGFVFSLFSALRFWVIYIQLYEKHGIATA